MNTYARRCLFIVAVLSIFPPLSGFAQKSPEGTASPPPTGGPLTPPGPPSRMMKTLLQIEPRYDLKDLYDQNHDGVDDDTNYEIVIRGAGSYYLSENLNVTRPNGIVVRASGVTIDLNGFSVNRFFGGSGNGIEIGEGAFAGTVSHGSVVKNGSISGFAYGVRAVVAGNVPRGGLYSGLTVSSCSTAGLQAGENWHIEKCRVHDNPGTGIIAQRGCVISECTAESNGTGGSNFYGIIAGVGSSIVNCLATGNTAVFGIFSAEGSTITNCSARSNTSASTTSGGIGVSSGSTVYRCTSTANVSTAATSTANTGMGFFLNPGSMIEGWHFHKQ